MQGVIDVRLLYSCVLIRVEAKPAHISRIYYQSILHQVNFAECDLIF